MINVVKGNILDSKEDIICHQVNVQGSMGGGVARQLANRYKELEDEYYLFCKSNNFDYEQLKGQVLVITKDKYIANMFSQRPNFQTDYTAMIECFKKIKEFAIPNLSIAIPYGIGCGIADGDWKTVYKIIGEIFKDYEVTLYRLNRR